MNPSATTEPDGTQFATWAKAKTPAELEAKLDNDEHPF